MQRTVSKGFRRSLCGWNSEKNRKIHQKPLYDWHHSERYTLIFRAKLRLIFFSIQWLSNFVFVPCSFCSTALPCTPYTHIDTLVLNVHAPCMALALAHRHCIVVFIVFFFSSSPQMAWHCCWQVFGYLIVRWGYQKTQHFSDLWAMFN